MGTRRIAAAVVALWVIGSTVPAAVDPPLPTSYTAEKLGSLTLTGTAVGALSPDGKTFAAGDKTVRVYDAVTFKPLSPEMSHGEQLKSLAFSRDGTRLLSVSGGYARVWDPQTGKPMSPRLQHGPTTRIEIACLSPDGTRLMTAAAELEDPRPGIKITPVNAPVPKVTEEQSEVRVWDIKTGEMDLSLPHPYYVQFAQFSPDGSHILTASVFLAGEAYVWRAKDGQRIGKPIKDALTGSIIAAFSVDGSRFVLNSWYEARVFETATLKQLQGVDDTAYKSLPTAVAISPDGKTFFRTDQSTDARGWDVATGKVIAGPMTGVTDLKEVAFSPDGRLMYVMSSAEWGGGMWDCRTGKRRWAAEDPVHYGHAALFMPDGSVRIIRTWFNGVGVFQVRPKK